MKKIFTYTMMLVMAAMTLTSCDEDAMLAYDMEGVWQGTIQGNFYYNRYRSNDYDTEISFVREGMRGGTGYEIDYNYSTRRYYRNYFNWTVSNGRIIIEYDDGATVIIRDYDTYKVGGNMRFRGYFQDYDTGDDLASFNLIKVVEPNDTYDYSYRYYASTRGIAPDGSTGEDVVGELPSDSTAVEQTAGAIDSTAIEQANGATDDTKATENR